MYSEEALYSIALRRCPLIGDVIFRKLVQKAGSAEEVWKLSKSGLTNIQGIGKRISQEIGNDDHLRFAEKELKFCEKNNIKILLRNQNELPPLLRECDDAPSILYLKGNLDSSISPLSIVGTRNITAYGKKFVQDFLENLPSRRMMTISGLALGADSEVHAKSLDNTIKTVAVLAHGFHTLYPAKNRNLSEQILENGGALVTEFNSSQKPDRENFIQRNRIIAGFSPATIIVETAFGGGSVSTATFANMYNREVFALPGKITDRYSQGCNMLIAQNKAATISTIKDLIEQLGLNDNIEKTGQLFPKSEIKINLPENQQTIYDEILKNPNISLDQLVENLDLSTSKILPVLLELELSGYIKSLSGRQFLANL